MKRKLPEIGSEEAKEWAKEWDAATHLGKIDLCQRSKVSYQLGKDFRCACKVKLPPPLQYLNKKASWEEHLDIIKSMDRLVALHQYVPTEISLSIPTELPIAITFTADWHLGMFGCDYDSFQTDMNVIETELGLQAYIGGDAYQNIIEAGKMGSSHNQVPISVQKGLYVLTLKKLKEKILCVGTGNHNYWTALAEGEDWDRELANRLKLVYTKHFGVVNLKVGNMIYPILRLHKGRFNSSFNLTHSCKQYQRMYCPRARIIVIEHQHISAMEQYRYNENECVAIRPGTYGIYDDYAQQNGFWGAHVANPTVILYPKEDRLVAFKDLREAVVYLRAVRS